MMSVLRKEIPADYLEVEALIEAAFKTMKISDHQEHRLVARLRRAPEFIPALSIVAEKDGELQGHILLTPISIANDTETFPALALAPVSVKPAWQRQGIGGQLIEEAHRQARELGHTTIVLVGHETYYPRFGYQLCRDFHIKLPFPAPDENCMVLALSEGVLTNVNGTVEYPASFFEE